MNKPAKFCEVKLNIIEGEPMADALANSFIPTTLTFQHRFAEEKTMKGRTRILLEDAIQTGRFSNLPDELKPLIKEAWEKIRG